MKRAGFTMIELIFVIVILGILAAVAIPKLAATRDDAKTSTDVANLATCITDLGGMYTGEGNITNVNASSACKQLKCFSISNDGNGSVTISDTTVADLYCTQARTMAGARDLNGTKSFGGSHVIY